MRPLALGLAVAALGCRPSADPATPAPPLVFAPGEAWPVRSTYPGVGQGRLVVTNSREDTLSVFDLTQVGEATLPELARVPVGLNPVEVEGPHHAAIAPGGQHLFIALSQYAPGTGSGPHGAHGSGTADGTLLKLSTEDHTLLATARVDRNPGDLAVSHDGTRVAVSHFDLLRISEAASGLAPSPDARVAIIDADTLERIAMVRTCAAPHGLRFSPDDRRLYVACYSDEVAVLKLDEPGFPVTRVKVAPSAGDAFTARYQPYAVAVSPGGEDVFVSCLQSGEVRLLRAGSLTIDGARTERVGGSPLLSDFSPDGLELFVPHQGDDRISVIDAVNGGEKRVFGLPGAQCLSVHQVTSLGAGRLAVVCEGDHRGPGALLVVDATSGAVSSASAVGVFPDYVGVVRP